MIKQVGIWGKGGVWVYKNIKRFFFSQNSRNSDRLEGFTIKTLVFCTSMICMSLQLKTLKNLVGEGA